MFFGWFELIIRLLYTQTYYWRLFFRVLFLLLGIELNTFTAFRTWLTAWRIEVWWIWMQFFNVSVWSINGYLNSLLSLKFTSMDTWRAVATGTRIRTAAKFLFTHFYLDNVIFSTIFLSRVMSIFAQYIYMVAKWCPDSLFCLKIFCSSSFISSYRVFLWTQSHVLFSAGMVIYGK